MCRDEKLASEVSPPSFSAFVRDVFVRTCTQMNCKLLLTYAHAFSIVRSLAQFRGWSMTSPSIKRTHGTK